MLALGVDEAIGIKIPACQFLYFNYSKPDPKTKKFVPVVLKVKNEHGQPADQLPEDVLQMAEVQNPNSRQITYLVLASQCFIDLFSIDIGSGVPKVTHIRKMKLSCSQICANIETPGKFFTAIKGTIYQYEINPAHEQSLILTKPLIPFSEDDDVRATALKHTFLRSESNAADSDAYLAVAIETSMEDFDLILLKRVDQKGRYEVTVIIESPHLREITQILVLTDFYNRLSFVTLGLDGWIKIWDEDGNQEREGV